MNKYYVEAIKIFELHSYDTTVKKCTYGHPMFFVKERNKFKKDKIIDVFGYGAITPEEILSEMNKAFAYCNKLNGVEE